MGDVRRGGLRAAVLATVVLAAVSCSAQRPAGPAVATGGSPGTASPVARTDRPRTTPPPATGSRGTEPTPEDSRPPELDWVPPEEEIDRMAIEAEAAYRDHLVTYDAAALTGFTDPALLETLLATAGGDTLDGLRDQADVLAGTGRTIHGDSEVLGIQPIGLNPPVAGGWGITVGFVACVVIASLVREADGTVVQLLDRDGPQYLQVLVADDDGVWLVVSQRVIRGPCPADLLGEDT